MFVLCGDTLTVGGCTCTDNSLALLVRAFSADPVGLGRSWPPGWPRGAAGLHGPMG